LLIVRASAQMESEWKSKCRHVSHLYALLRIYFIDPNMDSSGFVTVATTVIISDPDLDHSGRLRIPNINARIRFQTPGNGSAPDIPRINKQT
jgi:hypothetical protein